MRVDWDESGRGSEGAGPVVVGVDGAADVRWRRWQETRTTQSAAFLQASAGLLLLCDSICLTAL